MGNQSEFHSERNYWLVNWYFSIYVAYILTKKINRNSTTYVSLISVSVNKHIVSNFRLPDNLEIFNAKNLKMQIPTPLEFSLYVLTEAEKVGGENLNPHWSSFSVLNFGCCSI